MEKLHFATSNKHKFQEAQEILSRLGISIGHFEFRHNEIRSESPKEIATDSVNHAYALLKKPVFVEDSGLFVDALNGFPGTFSAWAYGKIGWKGILKLLEGETGRKAEFRACIAFHDGKKITTFKAACAGDIATNAMGEGGFGYDPIFIPKGYTETFAQSKGLKKELSHRYNVLTKLASYLNK